jgi:hypothetical protein
MTEWESLTGSHSITKLVPGAFFPGRFDPAAEISRAKKGARSENGLEAAL